MSLSTRIVFATVRVALAFGLSGAQSQTMQAPGSAFDAASIKPAQPGARGYSIRPLPGRVSAENVTLKLLIAEAYAVHDFQVSGGPKWIDSDRYDVEAKAAGDAPPSRKQLRAMLQNLLADRFGLTVRHETREMPVYLLETGKGGPRLQRAKQSQAPVVFRVLQRRQITAENAPLENLTEALTWLLGRPVLDRTGLRGSFDYKLEWSPDDLQLQSQEAPPQTDGNAPSLGGALQQQMGLKLASQRGPVDLIEVENAERPRAN
jgi:uncharacterized protein (TIGR03435 family)